MGRFLFGRKKSPKKGADAKGQVVMREQNGAPPMGNQGRLEQKAAIEMNEMQETPQMSRTSLADLYNQLRTSKRGGMFIGNSNSQFYTAVMTDLSDINSAMSKSFTQDALANQKLLINMEHMYQKLIKSCAAYIARDPSTNAGKHRKDLVTQIQERASTDLVALSAVRTDFCGLSPQEQSTKSWNELLDQSRTIRLSVQDFSQLNKAEGGQASEVYALKGSNTKVKNAAGKSVPLGELHFFKMEDEYDMTQSSAAGKVIENIFKRYPTLSKKEKSMIRELAINADSYDSNELKQKIDEISGKLSDEGKSAIKFILGNLRGAETTVELVQDLEIDKYEKVNMSRRNVATSRVAKLVGLDHLVAKSETAELYDEKTQRTFRGNLMQKAQGNMSLKEFTSKQNEQKKIGDKSMNVNVTGAFQRDMCNLQVLDVICGQADRHGGNIFISINNGEVSGLQGIDNDAAFGLNEQVTSSKDLNRHDRAIYDMNTGEMTLPYMDKNLADRILALEPDMLRFALKDLLKDEEIEAAIKRLEHTKTAIRKAQDTQKDTKQKRFLEDDEWNDDTAQDMINKAWEYRGASNKENIKSVKREIGSKENYLGRQLINMGTKLYDWDIGEGDTPQLKGRKNKA